MLRRNVTILTNESYEQLSSQNMSKFTHILCKIVDFYQKQFPILPQLPQVRQFVTQEPC